MTYKWNTLYLNSTSSTLKRVKRKELKVITTPLYILSAFDETVRESQPHRDCGDLIGGPWDATNAIEHHHSGCAIPLFRCSGGHRGVQAQNMPRKTKVRYMA
jgi:hypothetical protein